MKCLFPLRFAAPRTGLTRLVPSTGSEPVDRAVVTTSPAPHRLRQGLLAGALALRVLVPMAAGMALAPVVSQAAQQVMTNVCMGAPTPDFSVAPVPTLPLPLDVHGEQELKDDYFVFFPGIGSAQSNMGAEEAAQLQAMGVPAGHMVAHQSPFPNDSNFFSVGNAGTDTCNLLDYQQLTDPSSVLSQQQFGVLQAELHAAGAPTDARLVLIGHSAGGVEAGTMASLLVEHGRPVDAVMTLGTPQEAYNVPSANPDGTPIRQVVVQSAGDPVLGLTDHLGILRVPGNLDADSTVVSFGRTYDGLHMDHFSYLNSRIQPQLVTDLLDSHQPQAIQEP